jgi:hypothetical protein
LEIYFRFGYHTAITPAPNNTTNIITAAQFIFGGVMTPVTGSPSGGTISAKSEGVAALGVMFVASRFSVEGRCNLAESHNSWTRGREPRDTVLSGVAELLSGEFELPEATVVAGTALSSPLPMLTAGVILATGVVS